MQDISDKLNELIVDKQCSSLSAFIVIKDGLCSQESESNDGQSNRMYPGYYYDEPGMSNARRGRDGDGDGRYSEDSSYRRGRDAMGRYTSREGGYSGHEEKEQMMRQIEEMKRKVEKM